MTEKSASTHPPLPPTTEDDRFFWLRLLRSRRVGITTFWRLLGEHESAQAALAALPDIARAAGVSDYAVCPEEVVHAELRAARKAGARLICRGEPDYPRALGSVRDAPPLLWVIGNPELLNRPTIAIVGARNASSLGTRMARKLATELSDAGFIIASGLARGIDAAAHTAALGGGTIAVMAGGVDVIYPAENTQIAQDIAREGLRLSDQPMGLQPQARHFPARNRLISGLARAVVVVEAAARSGSLITAQTALDQGRDVLAVPGHPFDARAAGCNQLLRDGAVLVRNATDVIEAVGPAFDPADTARSATAQTELPLVDTTNVDQNHAQTAPKGLRQIAALHRAIMARLGPSPIAEDQLIRDLQDDPQRIAPVLVELELTGQITRHRGSLLSLGAESGSAEQPRPAH